MSNINESYDQPQIEAIIRDKYPLLEQSLLELLAIPSVQGTATDGAPFGADVKEAIDYCLNLADKFGFTTTDGEGYIGFADWPGNNDGQIGILSHLDVVPAEDKDWQYRPFTPQIVDGRIYGRGAIDDKGPLLACLFACAVLKEAGFRPSKTIRQIFGGNEESGFGDIEYFKKHFQEPDCGFSPDASFPVIIGEKGIIHWELSQKWQMQDQGDLLLVSIEAGTAANIVPASAQAVFKATLDGKKQIKDLLRQYPEKARIRISERDQQLIIDVKGRATHASTPEEGLNALSIILRLLSFINFAPQGAKTYINIITQLIGNDDYGCGMWMGAADELSFLTAVPVLLKVNQTSGTVAIDLRFPVTHTLDYYQKLTHAVAQKFDLTISTFEGKEPLLVKADSTPTRELLDVYHAHTGKEKTPLVIGGGTYARAFKNFVAFGPYLPNEKGMAHMADEYITQEKLLDLTRIYARAIYALAK